MYLLGDSVGGFGIVAKVGVARGIKEGRVLGNTVVDDNDGCYCNALATFLQLTSETFFIRFK